LLIKDNKLQTLHYKSVFEFPVALQPPR